MKNKENMTYGEYIDRKQVRQSIFTAILLMILGAFIGVFILGMFHIEEHEANIVLNAKVEYLQDEVDHYSDLLNSEREAHDEQVDFITDANHKLREENIKLKEELENSSVQEELHESYLACLEEIAYEYSRHTEIEGINNGDLKFIAKQISKAYNADDVIYHFVIVIYDDVFSVLDTWNCYTVYDGDEFMYADCKIIK